MNRNKRIKKSKKQVSWAPAILIAIGISILIIELLYYTLAEVIKSDNYGPFIEIACSEPNQTVELFISIDQNGMIEILPFVETGYEEHKIIWIRIRDRFLFEWEIEGDARAFHLKEQQGTFHTIDMGCKGVDRKVAFCIDSVGNGKKYTTIKLKHKYKKDFFYKKDGKCNIRLPYISQWMEQNILSYIQNHPDGFDISDNKYINTVIDNNSLYLPIIRYKISCIDYATVNNNYKMYNVTPKPDNRGLFLMWSGEMLFVPTLQYELITDTENNLLKNIIALLTGIALSLIFEGFRLRGKKNE